MASGVGGILRLGRLIDERWDALEADFADLGIDLGHALWVDQIGVRRFRVLVDGLPASARLWHEEQGGWTVGDHHLATIAMQTNAVYRQSLAAAGMKKREIPAPLLIRRPGPKPKPKSWVHEWASKAGGR